jgi:hypothetical protein
VNNKTRSLQLIRDKSIRSLTLLFYLSPILVGGKKIKNSHVKIVIMDFEELFPAHTDIIHDIGCRIVLFSFVVIKI